MSELNLVTGATGAVGYSIVRALLKRGHKVRILVRDRVRGEALYSDRVEYAIGDVTDTTTLIRAMDGVNTVYHAAGLPEQWQKDESVFERVNLQGTKNMVKAALTSGVKRFVYTSTMDVFKAPAGSKFNESIIDPQPKHTAYERSKQLADIEVTQAQDRGLKVVFLHPATVYGPSPTRSAGLNQFFRDFYAGKIPALLPGGMSVVFVDDVGEGHVLAAEKGTDGSRFLLSESYQSFAEMVKAMDEVRPIKKVPPTIPWFFADLISLAGGLLSKLTGRAPLIPRGQLLFLKWSAEALGEKARRELDWKPRSFKEGVAQTLREV